MSCHRRQRFPSWSDALTEVMKVGAGLALRIGWCDDCHGWHVVRRVLRYVTR